MGLSEIQTTGDAMEEDITIDELLDELASIVPPQRREGDIDRVQLAKHINRSPNTARKYMDDWAETPEWELLTVYDPAVGRTLLDQEGISIVALAIPIRSYHTDYKYRCRQQHPANDRLSYRYSHRAPTQPLRY